MGLFKRNKDSSSNETKCKECGTELSDPERLKRHKEKAHHKTKETCRVCGSEFYSSDELKKHKRKCK